MMPVDQALAARAASGRPIRVAMAGAGFMGRGVANQIINSVPGMRLVAISNRSLGAARQAFLEAGAAEPVEVASSSGLERAIERDEPAVTADALLLAQCELVDAVVDVTGAVEFGATLALECFRYGRTLVTMNVELDATAGAELAARAHEAGALYTIADGDQPGVEMNLVRFVRSIGLTPLVCGNIKGLQDPYRTPETQQAFAELWGQNPRMVTSFADGTKISFEQAAVANATGMRVAQRGMVGREHRGHIDELLKYYDVDQLRTLGGVVDYVVGATPAPGVFVFAAHDDPRQRHYLKLYKLGDGPLYSFYAPYHLCHFEVPLSIARAVLFGDIVLQSLPRPTVDVVTTAKRDLQQGDVLDGLGGFSAYGQCENVPVVDAEDLLPMGLAEGAELLRDVAKDAVIRRGDVRLPAGRLIDELRDAQDRGRRRDEERLAHV